MLVGSFYAYVLCRLRERSTRLRNTSRTRCTSTLIVLNYALCWLPYNLFVIWSLASPETFVAYAKFFRLAQYLIGIFPIVNPLLYDFHVSRLSWTFLRRLPTRLSGACQTERTALRHNHAINVISEELGVQVKRHREKRRHRRDARDRAIPGEQPAAGLG